MKSDLSNYEKWLEVSSSLGFKISKNDPRNIWFDLEEFVCWGFFHSEKNARTFSSVAHLVEEIGEYLSISKMYKILSSEAIPFNPCILGYFLEVLSSRVNKSQVKKLFSLARESDEVFFNAIKIDEKFLRWGKFGKYMNEGSSKYLSLRDLYNNEHVTLRVKGYKIIYSDIWVYLNHFKPSSIREISIKTHNEYSGIFKAFKNISRVKENSTN